MARLGLACLSFASRGPRAAYARAYNDIRYAPAKARLTPFCFWGEGKGAAESVQSPPQRNFIVQRPWSHRRQAARPGAVRSEVPPPSPPNPLLGKKTESILNLILTNTLNFTVTFKESPLRDLFFSKTVFSSFFPAFLREKRLPPPRCEHVADVVEASGSPVRQRERPSFSTDQ